MVLRVQLPGGPTSQVDAARRMRIASVFAIMFPERFDPLELTFGIKVSHVSSWNTKSGWQSESVTEHMIVRR